jgi:hypothetical protein
VKMIFSEEAASVEQYTTRTKTACVSAYNLKFFKGVSSVDERRERT